MGVDLIILYFTCFLFPLPYLGLIIRVVGEVRCYVSKLSTIFEQIPVQFPKKLVYINQIQT